MARKYNPKYEHKCCNIWFNIEGFLTIGCAHCSKVVKKIDISETTDMDWFQESVDYVKETHNRMCKKVK